MSASSYAMIVRDAMLSRAKAMPFFAGFNFGTNKAETIQPQAVPFCGVYFINEDLTPDGDADHGEPRFHSSALYGFSVIVQNNDAAAAEDKLDEAFVTLTNGLLTDPSLYLNPAAQIQGYTRGNRTHQFGAVGADQALPIAELRFTLTCDLGVIDYPPVITDPLKTIHVKTQWPMGGTPDEIASTQQVEAEYTLEQEQKNESVAARRRNAKTAATPNGKGLPRRGPG